MIKAVIAAQGKLKNKDADDLAWKRDMFLTDFGRDDHVALTYPDSGAVIAEALATLIGATGGLWFIPALLTAIGGVVRLNYGEK